MSTDAESTTADGADPTPMPPIVELIYRVARFLFDDDDEVENTVVLSSDWEFSQ